MPEGSEDRTFTQADVDDIVQKRLARDRTARVVKEPRTYAPDSPHSFYADLAAVTINPHRGEARTRMARHLAEVAHEIDAGTPEGRYAQRTLRGYVRETPELYDSLVGELRALTTGGGSTASSPSGFAAFVTPYWLMDEWAVFGSAERAFADQCHRLPLPPYGMQIYVPAMTSTTAAATQTEGSAVTETDPSTGLVGGQVATIAGKITLTQQVQDRVHGVATDSVIAKQLAQQLEAAVDVYAINAALTGAGTITDATAPASATFLGNFYTDLSAGREILTDTAGTRLRPTHVFTTSDLYGYVTSRTDNQGRPVLQPQFVPGFPLPANVDAGQQRSDVREAWSRFTGTIMPGGLLWFTDDNIPASGANTQILVAAPEEAVALLEQDEPIISVFPEAAAGSLNLILTAYKYVAAIVRYPKGVAAISGAEYPTSLV